MGSITIANGFRLKQELRGHAVADVTELEPFALGTEHMVCEPDGLGVVFQKEDRGVERRGAAFELAREFQAQGQRGRLSERHAHLLGHGRERLAAVEQGVDPDLGGREPGTVDVSPRGVVTGEEHRAKPVEIGRLGAPPRPLDGQGGQAQLERERLEHRRQRRPRARR